VRVVGAVAAELVVLRDLVAGESLLRLEMPREVDEAKPALESSDLRGQPRDRSVRRAGCAESAIETSLQLDDPAAERPCPCVDVRLNPFHRPRLGGRDVELVGELEDVRRAGVVIELGRERVAGTLAGEKLSDALGRNRFDLALLEASIGLLASFVSFLRGVVARSAPGGPGNEKDGRDSSRYAAAASQRSHARS
jgi:hypothetical protein